MIGSIVRKEDSTTFFLISPEYVEELENENKILKEHLDSVVEFYETELETKYKSILTELEDYLKLGMCEPAYIKGDMFWQNACEEVLDKIQELKEKYK